jgi:hypothetical protein
MRFRMRLTEDGVEYGVAFCLFAGCMQHGFYI